MLIKKVGEILTWETIHRPVMKSCVYCFHGRLAIWKKTASRILGCYRLLLSFVFYRSGTEKNTHKHAHTYAHIRTRRHAHTNTHARRHKLYWSRRLDGTLDETLASRVLCAPVLPSEGFFWCRPSIEVVTADPRTLVHRF